MFKEGSHINKSLLTLERVINALSENAKLCHVPFRDSKLTRILQPALGGNSRTAIVVTVTLAADFMEETKHSLAFASRAGNIRNNAVVNKVVDDATKILRLQRKVESLERRLSGDAKGSDKENRRLVLEAYKSQLRLTKMSEADWKERFARLVDSARDRRGRRQTICAPAINMNKIARLTSEPSGREDLGRMKKEDKKWTFKTILECLLRQQHLVLKPQETSCFTRYIKRREFSNKELSLVKAFRDSLSEVFSSSCNSEPKSIDKFRLKITKLEGDLNKEILRSGALQKEKTKLEVFNGQLAAELSEFRKAAKTQIAKHTEHKETTAKLEKTLDEKNSEIVRVNRLLLEAEKKIKEVQSERLEKVDLVEKNMKLKEELKYMRSDMNEREMRAEETETSTKLKKIIDEKCRDILRLNKLLAEAESKTKAMETVKKSVTDFEFEKAGLIERNGEFKQKLRGMQSRINELETRERKLNLCDKMNTEKIKKFETSRSNLEETIRVLKDKNEEFGESLFVERDKVKKLGDSLNAMNSNYQKERSVIKSLKQRLNDDEREKASLKKMKKQKDTELLDLKHQLQCELKEQKERYSTQMEILQEEKLKSEKMSQGNETKMKEFKAEMTNNIKALADAKALLNQSQKAHDNLKEKCQGQLQTKADKIDFLEKKLAESSTLLTKVSEKTERDQVDSVKKAVSRLKAENTQLILKIEKMADEIERRAELAETIKAKMLSKELKLCETSKQNDQLKNRLIEYDVKKALFESEKSSKKQFAHDKVGDNIVTQLKKEVTRLEKREVQLYQNYKAKIEKLAGEKDKKFTQFYEAASAQMSSLKSQVESACGKYSDCVDRVSKTRKNCDVLKTQNKALWLQNTRVFDTAFGFPGRNCREETDRLKRLRADLTGSIHLKLPKAILKVAKTTKTVKEGNCEADAFKKLLGSFEDACHAVEEIETLQLKENKEDGGTFSSLVALLCVERALQSSADFYETQFILVYEKFVKYRKKCEAFEKK